MYVIHYASEADHLGRRSLSHSEKFVGTEDDQRHHLVRKFLYRIVKRETVLPCDGPYDIKLPGLADLAERHYAAIGDRDRTVRNDSVHIDVYYDSQTLAMRAVSLRRIEREGMRSRFRQRYSRIGTYQMLGIMVDLAGLLV